jgi:superfamily II DNA/RNA helicase
VHQGVEHVLAEALSSSALITQELTQFCSREIKTVDVSTDADIKAQKSSLASLPDVVVGTPARVAEHLAAAVRLRAISAN